MPMNRLEPPLALALRSARSRVPEVPHRNFSGLASLSGGGPLTLSIQIVRWLSSISPNISPPVSTLSERVRPIRRISAAMPRRATSD
jgi:hypothetical protein